VRLIAKEHERLDRFLARELPDHSRTKLAKLVSDGSVLVDGASVKPSFALQAGMEVEVPEIADAPAHDLSPASIPLEVLFEDEFMLVVNKPRGLATHPATSLKEPSLVNALIGRKTVLSGVGEDFRPGIVHRLDRETTGLLVVAKTDQAHVKLARQMESKTAERRYLAVVGGFPERARFVIDAPMARSKSNRILMAVDPMGKPAVTHVKRLAQIVQGTCVAVRLETGRTHQIRVHLSAVGHPVLGDRLYALKKYSDGPLQLHAGYLELDHPVSGERMKFSVGPDEEFLGRGVVSEADLDPF
jgi:23S rRNA pseudouridine1911/1915/1917 synthase